MNRLEQYVKDCRSQFEEEPPAGHFERLQEKMNNKSQRITLLRWSVSVAASIAIVILAGIMLQYPEKQYDNMSLCENTIDMKACYIEKMHTIAGQIEELTRDLDPFERQEVLFDVENIINEVEGDFESELPEELPDTEAKLILSDFYRQNLESLEMIAKVTVMNYEL
jgi:hypothetical protein